jgi:uncharacterized protein
MQRRDFLSGATAAAIVSANFKAGAQVADAEHGQPLLTEAGSTAAAARIPRVTNAGEMRGEMLYRELGVTGEKVSVIGLGGSHLGLATVPEDEALRVIHQGLDRGINFLDNSWDFNEGRSEQRVGKALSQAGYRQKAFVMTKIDGRTKEVAANQIESNSGMMQNRRVTH